MASRHPALVLSSKVRAALALAVTADLASLALGVTGGLPWIAVLASAISSLVPVVAAWNQVEQIYPPLAPGAVQVPVASLKVPPGMLVAAKPDAESEAKQA